MTTATLDLDRFESLTKAAKRVSADSERIREFLAHWDWLAGFPATFLPVLFADLHRRGIWSEDDEARALRRVVHRLGAFPPAAELSPGVLTDAKEYLGMEEALLAGLRSGDFRALDRDGDGRLHFFRDLLRPVAVRLLRERLLDREQYAKILAAA